MRAAVAQLREEGRPVMLATDSHRARQELEASTGQPVVTIAALRYQVSNGGIELAPGTTIILDEASTVSTADLDWIRRLSERGGHRVALVGDPEQLGAVGRGGVFADFVAENPKAVVLLEKLWRFADQDEAKASMRLRRGDPEALGWYVDHDRLIAVRGTPEAQADAVAGVWETARAQGEVGVFADTNEQTLAANLAIQARRIATGEVVPADVPARGMWDEPVHAGDVVSLRGQDDGEPVRTDRRARVYNRDRGVVMSVGDDASVEVDFGRKGRAVLSAELVRRRVELGYAVTCQGGIGENVGRPEVAGTGIYWRSQAGDSRALLVGMTRGRDANLVIGQASSIEDLEAELADQLGRNRSDLTPRAALRGEGKDAPSRRPGPCGGDHQTALARAWAERDALAELMLDTTMGDAKAATAAKRLRDGGRRENDSKRGIFDRPSLGAYRKRTPQGEGHSNSRIRNGPALGAYRYRPPWRPDMGEAKSFFDYRRHYLTLLEEQARAADERLVARLREENRQAELAREAEQARRETHFAKMNWADAHVRHQERLEGLDTQIRGLSANRAGQLASAPPSYLVAEIGEPQGGQDFEWRRAAGEIESYRARWGIEDHEQALPAPTPAAEAHRQMVQEQLVELGYSAGVDGIRPL
jgi:hypothetical protein